MVGHVDDLAQLGNRLEQYPLDALLEGHLSQAASLAASEKAQVGDRPVNRHQLGTTAVGGDGGIHLFFDHLLNPVHKRAGEIAGRSLDRGWSGAVRVVHRQALFGELQSGAIELSGIDLGEDHRKLAMPFLHPVVGFVGKRDEGQLIGELGAMKTRDLDRQCELIIAGLVVPELENHVESVWLDAQNFGISHLCKDGSRSLFKSQMPTAVVILPTSTYRATDFLKAAESLGIQLVVASELPPPFDMGNRYLQINCADPVAAAEKIASFAEQVPVDGVVAADDQGVMVAAHASSFLGLTGNPPEGAAATRDKLLMRNRLASAEIDQPAYAGLGPGNSPSEVTAKVGFPLVIKPTDRSASQGVIRVDRPEDVEPAVARIRNIVGDDATLVVESYIPGAEIAIEGLIADGELTVLAVFDKPDNSSGPYFPETLFITPSRLPEASIAEAERMAAMSIRALGLTSGPVHVELRVEDGRARIIEVAARSIGGLCSRSLSFGLMGTTLESLILRNAIGQHRRTLHREPIASGVLMIPTPKSGILKGVAGKEETRQIEEITGIDYTIIPGSRIVAPPEGERYLGFVYARADTAEQVEAALRKAMTTLEVQLEG
jgi:biotin carboxylase